MEKEKQNKIIEILSSIPPILMKNMIHPVRSKFLITPGMHLVFHLLDKKRELTMSELSKRLFIPKPNTTTIVNRMIEMDLVERFNDENDRRIVMVRLSKKGYETNKLLNEGIAEDILNKLNILTDEELDTLYHSLLNVENMLTKISFSASDLIEN